MQNVVIEDDVRYAFLGMSRQVSPRGPVGKTKRTLIVIGFGWFDLPKTPGVYQPFGNDGPEFTIARVEENVLSVQSTGEIRIPLGQFNCVCPNEHELRYKS